MVENHNLAGSIYDASWSTFRQMLRDKAESAGCVVVEVNPRNTTQRCSRCWYILQGEKKLDLSKRAFECPKCGLSIDRDLNAARNILYLATTAGLAGSHAENIRPLESAFEPNQAGSLNLELYTAKSLLEA